MSVQLFLCQSRASSTREGRKAETGARIPVWVAVDAGWRTVGGPTGVCNASVRVKDLGEVWLLLCNELLQLGHLAHLFECENLILLVTVDRQTS